MKKISEVMDVIFLGILEDGKVNKIRLESDPGLLTLGEAISLVVGTGIRRGLIPPCKVKSVVDYLGEEGLQ